jgi:hypothetical protein
MAYASSKCKKDIDAITAEKLITARRRVENNEEITAQEEAEFWLAYQELWKLVQPLTAECIRSTEGPKARKTINWHIGFTLVVLVVLLFFQIYWVIGNQLTTRLADLLQQETELSEKIRVNQEEYTAIEVRFKENEKNSDSFQGYYEYAYSPEFERETAANLAMRAKLDSELESIKSQLERNSTILIAWSRPWNRPNDVTSYSERLAALDSKINNITNDINEKTDLLKSNTPGKTKLQEAENNVGKLESLLATLNQNPEANAAKIVEQNANLESAYAELYYFTQLNEDLKNLQNEKQSLELQKKTQSIQETSRRAQLVGLFVLIILQSYLLPLLYGLLGASTSSLRQLSREIDDVEFSDKKRIQHVLRIALGALSGIMVGWFSFLYEGTTLLGSVPPLAIAFLVGYNIELFFSLMDRLIDAVKRPENKKDNSSPLEADQKKKAPPASASAAP